MKKNSNYNYPAVKKSLEVAHSLTDVFEVMQDYIRHEGNESAGNLILFLMMAADETNNPYVRHYTDAMKGKPVNIVAKQIISVISAATIV